MQLERDIIPDGLPSSATTEDRIASLFYVPDTTRINHAFRINRNFNRRLLVAAGYGASWLEQESFSQLEVAAGHDRGRIKTRNAYLNARAPVMKSLSVNAHVKYSGRDNESTFPDGLLRLTDQPTLVAPRVDNLKTLKYGVEANWRARALNSSIALGWRGEDRDRDLTFGTSGRSILPGQTLYSEDSRSDELFVRLTARPAPGWNLRLAPSYLVADKTGLPTEPEEAFTLESRLSYAAPGGWLVSGFYDFTREKNGTNSFTDDSDGSSQQHTSEDRLHSAGLSLNFMPREYLSTHMTLFWTQNDFSSDLFTSTTSRWQPEVEFALLEESNYDIDSYYLDLGAEWDISHKTDLSLGYSFSRSEGEIASGTLLSSLQSATGRLDSVIDNSRHVFSIGMDYAFNRRALLQLNYAYNYYDDNAFNELSGGLNVLAVGVAMNF